MDSSLRCVGHACGESLHEQHVAALRRGTSASEYANEGRAAGGCNDCGTDKLCGGPDGGDSGKTCECSQKERCLSRAAVECWLPRRVVPTPVEHARECLCNLVDGARRARRAAPRGAGAGLMGLAVGSFCCAAAATKMRATTPQLLRVALAVVALCGFARLLSKHVGQIMPQRPLRIVMAYVVATAISSAAMTVAAAIAVATAARMCYRAAVDYGTRNVEPQRWAGLGLEALERGALLLQMILVRTQPPVLLSLF